MWPIVLGTFLLASGLSALPVSPDAEILPPSKDVLPTLATELMPPPPPKDNGSEKSPVLFLINLFGVKNQTSDEEVLQDDILSEVPDISEPLASILLVVGADDEDSPVSLEEVSKDLENEGFQVETLKGKDGEIKVIKVNIALDDLESTELSEENKDVLSTLRTKREAGQKNFERIRMKRHLCLKCKHGGGGNGGYGGGYGGGNGVGGGYNQGYQGQHQGHQGHQGCSTCGGGYQPPPPPQPTCNTCGGGYQQGGGGSYSQSSAQASASSQSGSYGK
ncbi:keratin, type I cytoskeletal 9-like isoform X2 [Belonocnema kinseyi]|uniref:keratin, type I cytoskeletal 9-like isoform X2 n=1 Tax=Belonocnema kinseyi TaxID=2817044 RepID=UPI00143D760F|nr:keratin, type I cytoskeletal 9-like isoform X2 [Belonocnema kinseyi]